MISGILLDLFEQQDRLFLLLPDEKVFRKQDYSHRTAQILAQILKS